MHKAEICSGIAGFSFGYCRRRFIMLVTKKVESSVNYAELEFFLLWCSYSLA